MFYSRNIGLITEKEQEKICKGSVLVGLVMSSAFMAIVVYVQELVPSKVGLIAGVFFWNQLCVLLCSFLPLLEILAVFLPKIETEN